LKEWDVAGFPMMMLGLPPPPPLLLLLMVAALLLLLLLMMPKAMKQAGEKGSDRFVSTQR
jgi:hypothetical protein